MPYLFGLIFALLSMFQTLGNEVRPEKFCLDSAWNGTECHQLSKVPLCASGEDVPAPAPRRDLTPSQPNSVFPCVMGKLLGRTAEKPRPCFCVSLSFDKMQRSSCDIFSGRPEMKFTVPLGSSKPSHQGVRQSWPPTLAGVPRVPRGQA